MKKNKNQTRKLVLLGIFTTLLIIQTFVPFMGYLPIPPLNPTIIHITVIVAAITMGTIDGMIVGGIWGIIRMIKAFTLPASPLDLLLWTNPLIAVLPRVLIGLFAGLFYHHVQSKKEDKSIFKISMSAIIGSFTNTIFVLFFIYLFYGKEYAQALSIDYTRLAYFLGTIIVTNGVAEAISAAFIVPLISRPLLKRKNR